MNKLIAIIIFACTSVSAIAQNGTRDLIYGKTVRDYIVLKPKFGEKGSVDIVIDKFPNNTINKTLPDKMTLKMRPQNRELNVMSVFFNPFNYTVILMDSTFADENFASLGKFMDAVSSMLNVLNDSASAAIKKTTEGDKIEPQEGDKAEAIITKLKNPELAEWKFQFGASNIADCKPGMDAMVFALYNLDTSFYKNSTSSFESQIQNWLKEIKKAATQDDFSKRTNDIEGLLTQLIAINKNDDKYLADFASNAGKLKLDDPTNKPYCMAFADYTRNFMVKIKKDYDSKHAARTKLIIAITDLKKTCTDFLSKVENGLVQVGRYPVEEEKVHEIKITFKPREIKFDDNTITITDQPAVTTNRIYLRASHFLVPEFGTGLFYTNLTYPKYGVDSTQKVASASDEHYPVVLASHLNLVINGFDGPVVPMLQIGVGTAKDRPSLLAGGGLRFLKPKNLSISYGRLWTWKKMLNTLKEGDKVSGTAALEKDLKFVLDNHTSYYIGIQYNF